MGSRASSRRRAAGPAWWQHTTIALLLVAGLCGAVAAQERPRDPLLETPVLLTANEIAYDQDLDIVTATGAVEISQNDRVLRADTVSYNRGANVVTASGNVTLLDPSGDVMFADHIELSEGLRDAIARNLRMLLADQSRLVASGARRGGGRITVMRQAVYSACELCRDNPERAPLWQIRSNSTIHDQVEQRIIHNDATLELFGVPVAWAPYIYHAAGGARRHSGFLAPELRTSSQLGFGATLPLFLTLGPSADLTLAPAFFSNQLPLLGAEYRQHFEAGTLRLNASVTNTARVDSLGNELPGRAMRWHVGGEGRFDIDEDWRARFDLARASDRTYISRYRLGRRYQLEDINTLTSNLRVERFVDRSYFAADAYAFQGLRPQDDDDLAPYVAPAIQYRWSTGPLFWGSRFAFDADALSIWRVEGSRTQRVAFGGGWTLPHVTDWGQVITLQATVRGEFYHVDNLGNPLEPFQATSEGTRGRVFPQVSLTASWPFLRRGDDYRTIIEPLVQVVAAPLLSSQDRFPNEDSRAVDFDETNLFRLNRFAGLDRFEEGSRVTYGVRFDTTRIDRQARLAVFVGQSYRFHHNNSDFPVGSGLDDQVSRIVGRVSASYRDFLSAYYRFQVDHDGTPRRTEVAFTVGPPAVRLSAGYLFVDKITQPGLITDIAQLSAQLDLRITENWRLQGRHIRDIGNTTPGALLTGVAVIYEDECFVVAVDVLRRNTGRADNPPDTSVVLRFVLRTLGDFAARI